MSVGGPGGPFNPYGTGGPRVTYQGGQRHGGDPYELERLRERAAEMEETLRKLNEEARPCAVVVEVRAKNMLVSFGAGNTLDINRLEGAAAGDRVLCNRNTMQAIEKLPRDIAPSGVIVSVERVSEDGNHVEATLMQMPRTFKRPPTMKIQQGERVILDPSMTYVIGSLGMPPAAFSFSAAVTTFWDDIGGHAEAKEHLQEAIELPLAHPELFAAYGKRNVKGVLLFGPPGTGKTILAKAAATSIGKAYGQKAGGFIYIKGPELLNPYIGKSEEAIRGLFSAAREFKKLHGYPCVIFIDECDALLGVRDRGLNVSINATTVPQFLAEMDGMDEAAAIFILATNRPDALDPAVVREGRVDRKVRVDRPRKEDSRQIFGIHLKNRPLGGEAGHVDIAMERLYSDELVLVPAQIVDGVQIGNDAIYMRDIVTGAVIADLIERASSRAMMRDIASTKRKKNAATGITSDDLLWAIGKSYDAVRDMARGVG